MNRTLRLAVFGIGAVGLAVAYVIAAGLLPHFGGDRHPYGDRSVREAIAHRTSNTVSSLAFDQRGFDTVGEEFILVLAVIGGTLLLRAQEDEDEGGDEDQAPRTPPVSDAVRLMGYLALPVTVVIGVYLIAHGSVSPGGGFQGGVALATAIHLLYVAGDYDALERIRPVPLFHATEAAGVAAYVAIGLGGIATGSAFLSNVIPLGSYQTMVSGGTVPLLSAAAGVAVLSSVVVLLSDFLKQTIVVRPKDGGS
jgi:multicomponent Na+:H+ antiporter subunit B